MKLPCRALGWCAKTVAASGPTNNYTCEDFSIWGDNAKWEITSIEKWTHDTEHFVLFGYKPTKKEYEDEWGVTIEYESYCDIKSFKQKGISLEKAVKDFFDEIDFITDLGQYNSVPFKS